MHDVSNVAKRNMDDGAISATFAQLLRVCNDFANNCALGTDIRDHGLTPELLAACYHALSNLRAPRRATASQGTERVDNASWRAYKQMIIERGEDFS